MPPKSSLTVTVSSPNAIELACPLKNDNGSDCQKRCIGERRYRSMIEHIRRTHPQHYIPKLPANETNLHLMAETPPPPPPRPRPLCPLPPPPAPPAPPALPLPAPTIPTENPAYNTARSNSPGRASILECLHPVEATAVLGLAQLHNWRANSAWNPEAGHVAHKLAPLFESSSLRELLPSPIERPPTRRSSILPTFQRRDPKPAGPLKCSVAEHGRKPVHERTKSKDRGRRMSTDGRKASLAEPQSPASRKWEELIEAARLAESDLDITAVRTPSEHHPSAPLKYPLTSAQVPQLPASSRQTSRAPLTPTLTRLPKFKPYRPSPLRRAITRPSPTYHHPSHLPFPSLDSVEFPSAGPTFHIPPSGLSSDIRSSVVRSSVVRCSDDSSSDVHSSDVRSSDFRSSDVRSSDFRTSDVRTSPTIPQPVKICCASCKRSVVAKNSYVCLSCIGGLCSDCVDRLTSDQHPRQPCPRCGEIHFQFKAIQLDFR